MSRDDLVSWRKEVIKARENWLAVIKLCDYKTDRELIKFCKEEASECLKHERACTQIIEKIDGKRAYCGELTGDKYGFLTPKVPKELENAFIFCYGIADYGLSEKESQE